MGHVGRSPLLSHSKNLSAWSVAGALSNWPPTCAEVALRGAARLGKAGL